MLLSQLCLNEGRTGLGMAGLELSEKMVLQGVKETGCPGVRRAYRVRGYLLLYTQDSYFFLSISVVIGVMEDFVVPWNLAVPKCTVLRSGFAIGE